MAIITISRGTYSGGEQIASQLASELGYDYLSREDLADQAKQFGVPFDKLQAAINKPPRFYKLLERERDQYLACTTMILCEKILKGNLVYYGHTGHLLLTGIPNILRVRVLSNIERRINPVVEKLGLSESEAKEYIKAIDHERDRWVRFLYGIDWHNPHLYDIIFNLAHTKISNTITALKAMAELPEFHLTEDSYRSIRNLHLGAKAHLKLTTDKRTNTTSVRVRAKDGIVYVICPPDSAEVVPQIKEVLKEISDIKEVHLTIASCSILYVQEDFNPESESFYDLINVADKFDAAIELMRIHTSYEDNHDATAAQHYHKITKAEETDFQEALTEMEVKHHCGGCLEFYGNAEALVPMLHTYTGYKLVVLGKLFSDKSAETSKRLKVEMKNLLMDNLNLQVVDANDLHFHVQTKTKDILRMVLFLLIAVLILIVIFTNQNMILQLLSGEQYRNWRILVTVTVVLVVPAFAYCYGTFSKILLKLFKLD